MKNKGPKPYRVVLTDPEGKEYEHAAGTGIITTRGHLLKGGVLRIYKDSSVLKVQQL